MESIKPNDSMLESKEEHFGNRLSQLLDQAGIPARGRKAWLERQFDVSKRTPLSWLEGQLPRHDKLKEIAALLNEMAELDEPVQTTEHWLMTGKRLQRESAKPTKSTNDYAELDHYTKSLILKEILETSDANQIDLHTLDREYVNRIINTLYSLIQKKGEDFIGTPEFKSILVGQLELAKLQIL